MKIWKFTLAITDKQRVELPRGSQVLCAQFQRDVLRLWAVVDPKEPLQVETLTAALSAE